MSYQSLSFYSDEVEVTFQGIDYLVKVSASGTYYYDAGNGENRAPESDIINTEHKVISATYLDADRETKKATDEILVELEARIDVEELLLSTLS